MKSIDSGSKERVLPEAIIGQEQQTHTQARCLLRTNRILDRGHSQLSRSDFRLDSAQTGREKPYSISNNHEYRVVRMIY